MGVPVSSVLADCALGDLGKRVLRKEAEQMFDSVLVVKTWTGFRLKSLGKFPKCHIRPSLNDLVSFPVEFFFEVLFYLFCLPAVSSAR